MKRIEHRKDGKFRVDENGNEEKIEAVKRHEITEETKERLKSAENFEEFKDAVLIVFGVETE